MCVCAKRTWDPSISWPNGLSAGQKTEKEHQPNVDCTSHTGQISTTVMMMTMMVLDIAFDNINGFGSHINFPIGLHPAYTWRHAHTHTRAHMLLHSTNVSATMNSFHKSIYRLTASSSTDDDNDDDDDEAATTTTTKTANSRCNGNSNTAPSTKV